MSIDPRHVPNVISRKAEHDNDRGGAVCELVTALAFGLKAENYYRPIFTTPHPGRGRSSTGRRNRGRRR